LPSNEGEALMPAVNSVLVVGAGAAGTATAILLAETGVSVELVEIRPDVGALGSGITLQRNALRVLHRLGVYPEVERLGYAFNTIGLRAPDAHGSLIAEFDSNGGEDLPSTLGMYRPDLARILVERAGALGVKTRFGTTVRALDQDAAGVDVTFADGSAGRFDLVVGADGLRSATRRMLGIDVEPEPTGMGIWRAFTRRPASVTHTEIVYGGAAYIAGYCPTGEDSMYCYLVEDAQDRSALTPAEQLAVMRGLAEHYHGPWDEVRALLTDPSRVNYTWYTAHLLDGPWHRGRVVLIGEAVHSCPPTMAQGAAMALEDALVLAELLGSAEVLDEAVWDAFTARRLERVRAVVDASVQIGRWLLAGEHAHVTGVVGKMAALTAEAP
jgi:2-polyprenyl-6-methoxyphenol hydroxylase-like FAD-dependent oxidoreductase